LVSRPDRVLIWSSQLSANDFPPVCAVTGAPAETWRKFRFVTAPSWAYLLLLLFCTGIGVVLGVLIYLVSFRATGHLPLTHASNRKLALVLWIPIALLALTPVLWIAAAIVGVTSVDQTQATIAVLLLLLGFVTFLAGGVGRFVITPLTGPRGKVMERQPGHFDELVELRRVHPAFVQAVKQMHAARASQSATLASSPGAPLQPSPN
jgi:hypothetical protein